MYVAVSAITTSPSGGTSTGAGTGAVTVSPQQPNYAYGTTVTLTANAAGGYIVTERMLAMFKTDKKKNAEKKDGA